ncbi:MAG TPA: disulfide bond formation protein DsbA [Gammaproteobacteria bacterium]|nr:disulfide bond formation protein DsbA [Gammaproteobacteria bacterium]|tara:strand:+ start:1480 stop:2136 length:657 start_codon:yes stop_codon:yes gene_type:complete
MNSTTFATTLEIVSDIVCPWCYIGKRRLDRALELLGSDNPITVRWKPYELNPKMPPGGLDRKSYYARKFGSSAYAEDLIANITANAHDDGLPMEYANIKRVPNTRTAHRLIWLAEQFDCQDAIVDALFQAYFVEGSNIEDRMVLFNIAVSTGISDEVVNKFLGGDEALDIIATEVKAAQDAGIQGVPAFVLNGHFLFSGAQSPETISLTIKRAIAKGL